jgi:hypothetical protein
LSYHPAFTVTFIFFFNLFFLLVALRIDSLIADVLARSEDVSILQVAADLSMHRTDYVTATSLLERIYRLRISSRYDALIADFCLAADSILAHSAVHVHIGEKAALQKSLSIIVSFMRRTQVCISFLF